MIHQSNSKWFAPDVAIANSGIVSVGRFEANYAKQRLTQAGEGVQDIVFAGFYGKERPRTLISDEINWIRDDPGLPSDGGRQGVQIGLHVVSARTISDEIYG